MQIEATAEIYGCRRVSQDDPFKWCHFLHSVTKEFHFQTSSREGFIDLSGHALRCDLGAFIRHIPVSSTTTENHQRPNGAAVSEQRLAFNSSSFPLLRSGMVSMPCLS